MHDGHSMRHMDQRDWVRQRRIERERRERVSTLLAALLLIALLAIFAIVGSMDYADETRELAYWAERGVTLYRG